MVCTTIEAAADFERAIRAAERNGPSPEAARVRDALIEAIRSELADVGLTRTGLQRLREAQVTHHQIVREMLLSHLEPRDLKRLGDLWERAMPGAVSSPTWPL